VAAARERGLDGLTANQAADGSWGKTYTVAVTSFACLAYLSAADEPYGRPRGRVLVKGLRFLLASQKDGLFPRRGTPGSTGRASPPWPCPKPTAAPSSPAASPTST
jgi:hypothetical protein